MCFFPAWPLSHFTTCLPSPRTPAPLFLTHTYTHTHTCLLFKTCVRQRARTHARTHARAHTHTHTNARARAHTHAHAHAHTHALTHTHTHARTHARTHTHTHTQTHKHTRTHTHTNTHDHSDCRKLNLHSLETRDGRRQQHGTETSRIWLHWPVAAGCGRETTQGPQPTQRPHVQENVAGTITILQLQSWRPDGRTYTAEMPASADKTKINVWPTAIQLHKLYGSKEELEKWRRHSSCTLDTV